MFTGIVSAVGAIADVQPLGSGPSHGRRLAIQTPAGWLADVTLGDSIALNGACMTVTSLDVDRSRFTVDISAESLARTAGLGATGPVNLEKALRTNDRLGGHLVSGHVDGVGRVAAFAPVGESWRLVVLAPRELARYVAIKGSVTVNGVSLTVNSVHDLPDGCAFEINLIPHTLSHTTLGALKRGDGVNLEIDLIARYVERMLGAQGGLWAPRGNLADPASDTSNPGGA
jgi:riboflavin synthase